MYAKITLEEGKGVEIAPSLGALEQVNYSFNPSGKTEVAVLKAIAGLFVEYCNYVAASNPKGGRELALARTNMEQASMWAVKGATR